MTTVRENCKVGNFGSGEFYGIGSV